MRLSSLIPLLFVEKTLRRHWNYGRIRAERWFLLVGISELFTGGGDRRRLPCGSIFFPFFSSTPVTAGTPAFIADDWVVSAFFDIDGLRRCLERYEDERGR